MRLGDLDALREELLECAAEGRPVKVAHGARVDRTGLVPTLRPVPPPPRAAPVVPEVPAAPSVDGAPTAPPASHKDTQP